MSRIRILPENLANQIAAGEVVERPASVVKELLENAVDAGAATVSVEVAGNAVGLIRVLDDGCGMDQDDLLLSLERHATSKITDPEQLAAINTLGFRGEALPSIASVARLTMLSRPRTADLGSRVEARYGRVVEVRESGAAIGTSIEVRDLFGNVPARRKFLKPPRTELHHLEEAVKNCGLALPGLGVTLRVDDRLVLQWPAGVDDQAGRIRRLLGRAGREAALLPVAGAGEDGLTVSGCLLAPEDSPATGPGLRLFVNGRPVRDRMLAHAVAEGMQNFLMRGRQPAGVLLVTLAAGMVDVNVHPTKQEIRFQQPRLVHGAVVAAVREAMVAAQAGRKAHFFGRGERETPVALATGEPRSLFSARSSSASMGGRGESAYPAVANGTQTHPGRPPEPRPATPISPKGGSGGTEPLPAATVPPPWPHAPTLLVEAEEDAPALRLLGQVDNAYILCAVGDGLLVVDQHAAHERLLFERLRRQYLASGLASQALLFPAVMECSPAEGALLAEHGEEIARFGLVIEPFGGDSQVVKAVPAIMAGIAPAEIVAGILARYREEGAGRQEARRLEAVLAGMACQAAVKAGQPLGEAEMARLLSEMQAAAIFSHCPHGRPVARRFSGAEMARWFNRT